jgi:hypothetical protein
MRIRYSLSLAFLLVAFLTFFLAANTFAADKLMNVQGKVHMLDKSASTITVELKPGGATRKVIFNADTKFLYGHSKDSKPGSLDQVKEGNYISCAGTYEGNKLELKATECIYRETK